MAAGNMPAAEVEVTPETVHLLLREQRAELADLEVAVLSSGWDNVSFRVGAGLVARFPRRALAVPLLENEARWLPGLATALPLPIPVPVFVGRPGHGYPWQWSLVPYLPGDPAGSTTIDEERCAVQLAGFLTSLHQPAPDDAPVNPYRGVDLAERERALRERLHGLGDMLDRPNLEAIWARARDTPSLSGPRRWLHGDLHPMNILVEDGSITAVIDFGDVAAGDPATDLAVAWMLFGHETRRTLQTFYQGSDDAIWDRARGWALALGVAYLAHSADNPAMARIGRRTLRALIGES